MPTAPRTAVSASTTTAPATTAPAVARPRVKVCGVTTVDDARRAALLGADFIGLNFYPPSPRALDGRRAAAIAESVRAAGGRSRLVGVFVNRPTAEVRAIDRQVGLDLLQFHGDEPAAALAPFAERAIKVFRVRDRIDRQAVASFDQATAAVPVWGFLFDTLDPGYGGSGRGWRFASLRGLETRRPALVAGGIGPDNVRDVVARAAPWGIDVCSGVESAPGRKDPARLERLFQEIDHGQSPSTT